LLVTGIVEDAVYGAGWDGDTTHSPSQNAVFDKIETIYDYEASIYYWMDLQSVLPNQTYISTLGSDGWNLAVNTAFGSLTWIGCSNQMPDRTKVALDGTVKYLRITAATAYWSNTGSVNNQLQIIMYTRSTAGATSTKINQTITLNPASGAVQSTALTVTAATLSASLLNFNWNFYFKQVGANNIRFAGILVTFTYA
jgi:hypothetical protein